MFLLGRRLDTSRNGDLQKQLLRLMRCKDSVTKLDASGVEFISKTGLLMLAACREALGKTGTELQITNPSKEFILAAERQGLSPSLIPIQVITKQTKACP